jgi:putative DNA primase/helicase
MADPFKTRDDLTAEERAELVGEAFRKLALEKAESAAKPEATEHEAFRESAVLEKISALDDLQYEKQRAELAKSIGVRASVLDKMRKASTVQPGNLQGREIQLDDPEPWPEHVNGAELFDAIERQLRRFLVLPDHSIVPFILWTALSYVVDEIDVLPMLVFSSPVKRSGKTTALECVRRLVRKPLTSSTISSAALYRVVEKCAPALLIDEADHIFKENEDLRTLINASFTRTAAYAIRCVGDDQEPRQFSTWCAKALALIGELPGTLADRSLIVKMRRKGSGETVERLRADEDDGFMDLRRKLARFAFNTKMERAASDPDVPRELNDRAADCWRELLRIAEAVGGDWPSRTRLSAVLMQDTDDDEDSRVQLLRDLQGIFASRPGEVRISSAELVASLLELESRPWSEWRQGRPLTSNGLARLLHGFGIRATAAKVAGKTRQAYQVSAFDDAFLRYLPNKCNLQPEGVKDLSGNELTSCSPVLVVDEKHNQEADSCGMQMQPKPEGNLFNSIQNNDISPESCELQMDWEGEAKEAHTDYRGTTELERDLLLAVGYHAASDVAQIAQEVGSLEPETVRKALDSLVIRKFVQRDDAGRYSLILDSKEISA